MSGDGTSAAQAGSDEEFSQDLADRAALRRVGGLSTELQDITEVEYRQIRLERVVLVGVWTEGTWEDAERSLRELAALAETAGSEVLEGLVQRRKKPDAATYIGSGKAAELRDIVVATDADTVICDGELSPGQLRKLEEVVKVKVAGRKRPTVIRRLRSTTGLSVRAMSNYLDELQAHASSELGVRFSVRDWYEYAGVARPQPKQRAEAREEAVA